MRAERAVVPSCLPLVLFISLPLLEAAPAAAGAVLSAVSGAVLVHSQGWTTVSRTPYPLEPGETVRTAARASATLTFPDGSRVELAGNASFTLQQTQENDYSMSLSFGRLKAFVERLASRRFQVRTPTAVCAVRGTEFQVEVLGDGTTNVDLFRGLLAVDDKHGREILLHPDQSTRVDMKGLHESRKTASFKANARQRFKNVMRRELAMDAARKRVQSQVVHQLRQDDYEQGKTVLNAFGQTVRVEEFITRPKPDQFKLVVLNSSKAGEDYFYYLGTFNTTLPTDLSVALSQLSGRPGVAPTYYLTSIENGRSNGTDSVIEIANGGHLVNVNNNPSNDPAEVVTSYFNPTLNAFVPVPTGTAFYKTLFDNEGLYVDGQLKSGWTGSGLQTYNPGFGALSPTLALNNDPITGTPLAAPLPTANPLSHTFPDSNLIHEVLYQSFFDGSFIQWDNYIVNNQGQIATPGEFAATTSGNSFTQQLLNFNYEQVISASEFNGRTIDLVVTPKILVQSGLIQ